MIETNVIYLLDICSNLIVQNKLVVLIPDQILSLLP